MVLMSKAQTFLAHVDRVSQAPQLSAEAKKLKKDDEEALLCWAVGGDDELGAQIADACKSALLNQVRFVDWHVGKGSRGCVVTGLEKERCLFVVRFQLLTGLDKKDVCSFLKTLTGSDKEMFVRF